MIRVKVDLTNPGQFFACCGVFELAHRLDEAAVAHFEGGHFVVACKGSLQETVETARALRLNDLDPRHATGSPLHLAAPADLRLDWWKDKRAGGSALKPWAGTMRGGRMARAMQGVLGDALALGEDLFDYGAVVLDDEGKKAEPFYFDARRGANARSIDVGFSTDSLKIETTAFPAVEFFCLLGLQRFRPALTSKPRVGDYSAWTRPLPIRVAALAVCGRVPTPGARTFRFENAFRTDQRKHKAFSPATPITGASHG